MALGAVACGADAPEKRAQPPARVTAPAPTSTSAPVLPAGTVYVAHAAGPKLDVYASPTATTPERALANPIETGGPLVLLVEADDGGPRVQVQLPARPNGSRGWVDRGAVQLLTNPYRIEVSVGARRLRLLEANKEILATPVAVGAPATPTPLGHFYLTELLIQPNPGGAYGPFAYGLSAHSNVLTDFNGGSGQVGMHGTNVPSSIGRAVSHGCIRLPNDVITKVRAYLPLGTPIDVVA